MWVTLPGGNRAHPCTVGPHGGRRMILALFSGRRLRTSPEPGQASEPGPTLHPGAQRRRPQGARPHRRAPRARGARPGAQPGGGIEHWSLIGAAWAAGATPRQMEARALKVRRRDVFQVARVEVAIRRLMAPALYRKEPLETLVDDLVGDITFRDLKRRLLVNTTDLHSGMQVMWGLPGLLDARVADAVTASCALPGIFPPRVIAGRAYVDGAVVENLPVRLAASLGTGPIIAVNVAATSILRQAHETEGFAATYIRGLEIVMQTQIEDQLRDWNGPPLILVQPRVEHISMFEFDKTAELIEAGYRSTADTLDRLGRDLHLVERGMHPTRRLRVLVDDQRC